MIEDIRFALHESVYEWAEDLCIVRKNYHGGELGKEYVENIFSCSLKKDSHQRNWHNKKLNSFEKLKLRDTKIDQMT